MGIVIFLVFGFSVGLIARAVVSPGPRMSLLMTALLGIVGSFFGAFLANLIADRPLVEPTSAGIIGSIVGAAIVMAAVGPLVGGRRVTV
jgi:uncharacterized membrane protein YeaQ/YmgE (transglycosylase-associated protein family)